MIRSTAWILTFLPALAAPAATLNGTWDGTILQGNDRVAFRMDVAADRVCFFEDTQPVCSTSATLESNKIVAQWDYLKTELRLEAADGALAGVYHSFRSNRDMQLQARPHQALPKPTAPPAKLDGEWETHIVDRPGPGQQLFLQQKGSEIKGTILRLDGDDGALVGHVDGNHFTMSHFSGDRPAVMEGDLQPDGTIDLRLGARKMTALRPDAARARNLTPPNNPNTWAHAKNPDEPFHFRFPDVNGKLYTEDNFRGKALIVTITGSWCPNCRDEAPFLGELYQRYHPKGLEIAALCFEDAADTEHVQLRAFVRKFGIQYPTLLPGDSSKLLEAVPQIENLSAYPTSIYIGRDGRVRSVHTGFPSSGAGEELTRTKEEIRTLVERILAEK
jgi:thiol-disulfide isomerase/thioredoxin